MVCGFSRRELSCGLLETGIALIETELDMLMSRFDRVQRLSQYINMRAPGRAGQCVHARTHTYSHSLALTHAYSLRRSLARSLSHTHTLTYSHSLTRSLNRSLAHSLTPAPVLRCSDMRCEATAQLQRNAAGHRPGRPGPIRPVPMLRLVAGFELGGGGALRGLSRV